MPLSGLDTAVIARCLSQVAEQEGDHADAFIERLEQVELRSGGTPGVRRRREDGFSIRLERDGRCWSVSGDRIDGEALTRGLRRVARARPTAPALVAPFRLSTVPAEGLARMQRFVPAVVRQIRKLHAAFPLDLTVRRHRRWIQVVGTRLVPPAESEIYYSCSADLPWGSYGALLPEIDAAAARRVGSELAAGFAARDASPPEPSEGAVVLAPAAAAVFLHEAVAHVLETDNLGLSGRLEAAIGVQLGSELLDVVDDPSTAPPGVRRTSDDEGHLVQRRCLLRGGVVDQLLGDSAAARQSPAVAPGAGRRSDRHHPPVPRSFHLELLAGDCSDRQLLEEAEGALHVSRVESGSLDPLTGRFVLRFPFARRVRHGELAERTGRCRLVGRVADLLGSVSAVGADRLSTGGGWCAKDGQRMPVWATTPSIRIESARIEPS